ncbi:hypothetical protein FISHEDRAFT_62909 [Fistulina hepatica ATCC 64428]|uniref:Uncharacterized protein n=1 Tax=Fistulina hepatica ATCC 64428 TaxID=1128425 RepID=A0A0D6ZZZ3_9AGAR|nr:hypothetical protein FISHEDRAFT_62909 [Fistulina hepatica ATCC 64428]
MPQSRKFTDEELRTAERMAIYSSKLHMDFQCHCNALQRENKAEVDRIWQRLSGQENRPPQGWRPEAAEREDYRRQMEEIRQKTPTTIEETPFCIEGYAKRMGTTVEEGMSRYWTQLLANSIDPAYYTEWAKIKQFEENRRQRNDRKNKKPPKRILTRYNRPIPSEHEVGDCNSEPQAVTWADVAQLRRVQISANRGRHWGDDQGAMRLVNNFFEYTDDATGDQVLCQVVGCYKAAGKNEAHLDIVFEGCGESPVRVPRSSFIKDMLKSCKGKWSSYIYLK